MPVGKAGESPSSALRRHGLSPRRRLGQNFLRDRSVLERILQAADLTDVDEVLEIGPGTGVLTRALAERAQRVVAIELDESLVALLKRELAPFRNLEIRQGNVLGFDPCTAFPGPYKLLGNIPYYISGPILRHFLEAACPPSVLVLMLQWEVARRITAAPGRLSLLAISVQYYAQPTIVVRVPAGAFTPRPKVDSAVIQIVPYAEKPQPAERTAFFTVTRAGFSMRRKQLANSLARGLQLSRSETESLLRTAGIGPELRAEALRIDDWKRLASAWREGGRR